jgi:hypothetical protein
MYPPHMHVSSSSYARILLLICMHPKLLMPSWCVYVPSSSYACILLMHVSKATDAILVCACVYVHRHRHTKRGTVYTRRRLCKNAHVFTCAYTHSTLVTHTHTYIRMYIRMDIRMYVRLYTYMNTFIRINRRWTMGR